MTTRYYDPWTALEHLRREMDAGYRQTPNTTHHDQADSTIVTSQWVPAVDIRENDHAFILDAELPGVDLQTVDLTVDKGVLTMKGQRQTVPAVSQNGSFERLERTQGSFHRRFTLPESAASDAITARGQHGVLQITIPKQAIARSRRIDVNIRS